MIQRTLEAAELFDPVKDFRMFRLLSIFIDAWADHNWSIWETALLEDERQQGSRDRGGWNDDPIRKRLSQWGVVDQHGVYLLAGLTKAETEVAFLAFDRGYLTYKANGDEVLDAKGIAKQLNRPATTVRVQFYRAKERLRKLAA